MGKAIGEQGRDFLLCPPKEGIAVDQARLVIDKYFREHPEKLHEEAGFLAAEAFMAAFPCRKSN
jgi:hypothetical protein